MVRDTNLDPYLVIVIIHTECRDTVKTTQTDIFSL